MLRRNRPKGLHNKQKKLQVESHQNDSVKFTKAILQLTQTQTKALEKTNRQILSHVCIVQTFKK